MRSVQASGVTGRLPVFGMCWGQETCCNTCKMQPNLHYDAKCQKTIEVLIKIWCHLRRFVCLMYKGYLHARVLFLVSNLCTLRLDHHPISALRMHALLLIFSPVLLTLAAQLRSLMFDVLCRFPGTYAAYDNAITSAVDSKMLMEAAIYTSTEPKAANHHFNIHNGDTFRWSQVQLNKC